MIGLFASLLLFWSSLMLTYLLALVVGLSSFSLYMSAFFYPELYRKGDLAWSGVGLFYALVLWFSAERITGGVLLGQIAGVSLLGWLGWQAANARWGQASSEQQASIQTGLEKIISPERRSQITAQLNQQAAKAKTWGQALLNTTAKSPIEAASASYQPLKPEDFGQPPLTIDTATEVVVAIETVADPMGTAAPIAQPQPAATGLFKSVTNLFNQPKKNTSTYVRKSAEEQAQAAVVTAQDAVDDALTALKDEAAAIGTDLGQDRQNAIEPTIPATGEISTDQATAAITDNITEVIKPATDPIDHIK